MAAIPYVIVVRNSQSNPPGLRMTGLAPTWVFLKRLADGTDVTPEPAIAEIGFGQYQFGYDPEASGEASGQIDVGATLTNLLDRYPDVVLAADSSRLASLGGVVAGVQSTLDAYAELNPAGVVADVAPTAGGFVMALADASALPATFVWRGGLVCFGSGALAGGKYAVATYTRLTSTTARVTFSPVLPATPADGDTFTLV
jgi:hypothetical protein